VQIPVKEVLTIVGIKSAFTAEGWKAESISSNSIADHAGVKAGDVIEAINDQALTEKTAFGNKFNGKSLRVRRGGATMQIVLKN
jgi:S1-C subfamily serine protease